MVKFFRPWASEQMEVIHAEETRLVMPRQASTDYKLVLIERGSREFYYRRAISTVSTGDLVVVHPGEVNGSQAAGAAATVRILSLSPTLLREAASQEHKWDGLPFFSPFLISDTALAADLLRLFTALEGPVSVLEQQTRLFDFLVRLQGRSGRFPAEPGGEEQSTIKCAREFLEENYQDDVSLTQLALLVGLSPCYLCRAFRRQIGIPPHAYQTGVRIARARTLLAAGHSAGAVAALTGFFDQAHFTHLFTRYVKTTPAAYARAVAVRSIGHKSISYKTCGERPV